MMDGLAEILPPLAEARHGIGGNNPPLTELLAEETVDLKRRADDLIASAGRAAVTDDETAGKATTLAKMLAEHAKTIDKAREERKKPFLEAGRTVDSVFAALKQPVDLAKIQVVALVDAYRRKKEAEAAAERRRLEEEARKAREAAEAAERAQRDAEERERQAREKAAAAETAKERAEADRKAAEDRLAREIEARRQRERADELAKQAAQTTAAPIASEYGQKAFARKVTKHRITDAKAAMKHAMKIDPARFAATLDEVIKGQIKAKVATFPGVEFYEETATVIR